MSQVEVMSKNRALKRIAYYITPHGFGHAIRSLEVMRRLIDRDPSVDITIVSDIPELLIGQNVGRMLPCRKRRLDVGLVQQDSLRFDLEATREVLEDLHCRSEGLVEEEVHFLRSREIGAVVADIPFLPFVAASRCGIPSIGISNFSWDWIYRAYAHGEPRWGGFVEWIREAYRHCHLFLQLPMSGDCSVFRHVREVPLVARKAKHKPEATRKILGCLPEQKVYLISFAVLELDEEAQGRLERIEHAVFLYKRPIRFHFKNSRSLDDFHELSYPDVVAAVDGVVTKPGYGIVADCLAHGTPMIYTDRGFFPEYNILVREMTRLLSTVYMPSKDLYAGRWAPAVRQIENMPRRLPEIRSDGADVCARVILDSIE